MQQKSPNLWNEEQEYRNYNQYKRKRDKSFLQAFSSIVFSLLLIVLNSIIAQDFKISPYPIYLFAMIGLLIGILLLYKTLLIEKPFVFGRYELYKNFDVGEMYTSRVKRELLVELGNDESSISEETEKLKTTLVNSTIQEASLSYLFKDLYNLEKNYNNSIERSRNNANFNLILGLIIGFIGFVFLGLIIFEKQTIIPKDYLYILIPRVTFLICIEFLSYFFLTLYKENLNDIKYFQNEISNLNFKITAIKLTLNLDNKDYLKKIIDSLIKDDRNTVIKNNGSTKTLIKNGKDITKYLSEIIGLLKR